MANEKMINTRIQLKYDTLANWNASTFKLKAGELAIVTLATEDGKATEKANQHPILFKVGTGNHTFSELPYASALAADVYSWAKASDVRLTGKTIEFVGGKNAEGKDIILESIELNYINSAEAQDLIDAALDAINDEKTGILAQAKGYADGLAENYDAAGAAAGVQTALEAEIAKKVNQDAYDKDKATFAIADTVNQGLALKADKSVVDAMYTNDTIDKKVQAAKTYAEGLVNAIHAQTDYTVTITETTDGLASDIAKKYTFTQNGAEIGTINLAKELVVTSGSVKEVTTTDVPYTGAEIGDKYIELVIANQDAPIYVPAKDLVDIYTAAASATEVQVAISNTNEISATLVDGGITETKLSDDVKTKLNKTWEEVGVAKGLVKGLEDGQVKANKEAIDNLEKEFNTETGRVKVAEGKISTLEGNVTTLQDVVNGYTDAGSIKAAVDAAQAKADTAIQTAGTGLKVTGTEVGFDDTCVFIFNCGSATTNID